MSSVKPKTWIYIIAFAAAANGVLGNVPITSLVVTANKRLQPPIPTGNLAMLSSAMPSPPLTSDPNFSKTDTRRPSSGSSKSGTLHLVKKFLTTTQDGSSRRSKHQQPYSDLTQEKLEVFNDTIAIADDINKKTSGYSPYYKGLTDSSLALNRQRTAGSPGRESHAPTVASSTSFSTSFIIRMQEMSSCFGSSRKKKKNGENEERDVKIYSGRAPPIVDEKPLRERASSPVTNRIVDLELEKDAYDNNIRASHSHNIERFTWANRYRPAALQHFICNRDKALELQATVRLLSYSFSATPLLLSFTSVKQWLNGSTDIIYSTKIVFMSSDYPN